MAKNITITILVVIVVVLAFLALDGRFQNPLPDLKVQSPLVFGETAPLPTTTGAEAKPMPTPEANAPEPTDVPAVIYTDLCADRANPAWTSLVERNTLTQAVYEAWLAEVQTNGGAVFGASKCSLPVDSRVFDPAREVSGSGPAQLVTRYRFSGIWNPEADETFTLAAGCGFEPLFGQGDAPVAVFIDGQTIRLQNNVSNGVSVVGMVTCGQ